MPDTTTGRTVYRFGLYEVDDRTGEVRKQGRPLKLRGRPFDILVLLLTRGGDVVSREELRQELWPADTFVDFDHGLNSAMNRLRDALGDAAENPRFIETLPRRGYRFIAPVTVVQAPAPVATFRAPATALEAAPPPQPDGAPTYPLQPHSRAMVVSRPSRVVLGLAAAALAVAVAVAALYFRVVRTPPSPASSKMTLAVLPFENLSAEADQDYFSEGFTDEMIA